MNIGFSVSLSRHFSTEWMMISHPPQQFSFCIKAGRPELVEGGIGLLPRGATA